jgi:hypothetical protein
MGGVNIVQSTQCLLDALTETLRSPELNRCAFEQAFSGAQQLFLVTDLWALLLDRA